MKPENLQQDFGINNFKIYKIMKNWNWKQWTAVGITAATIITGIVLHFVQPTVSYAFTEAMIAGGFVLGSVAGYLFKQNYGN